MSKYAIISKSVPQICISLEHLGFKLIHTECVDEFIAYERNHADMQCLKVNNRIFVLSQCKKLAQTLMSLGLDVHYTSNVASKQYPNNILLNVMIIGKTVIGKLDSIDKSVIEYCEESGYSFIDVKQGYTACSCVKISDNAIITPDNSIYKALKSTDIDVLKISEGHIILDGAKGSEFGFIGGSSAMLDSNNLLFFGNIKKHPDYDDIKSFCKNTGVHIHQIPEIPLTDIGGAILLNI